MRLFGATIRFHALFNFVVLTLACCTLLTVALINIMEAIHPLLIHLPRQPQSGCNGHPSYCARSYSNITQLATHNSAFVGILPTDNQNVDVMAQLDAGIRFLQAQTHRNLLGELSLCHTSCWLKDAGTLEGYLKVIKHWLDKHPMEVVTLLLTNGDSLNVSDFTHPFHASGIAHYAYTPLPSHNSGILDSWPTLGALVANGNRLVAFLDYGADTDEMAYLLPEFEYFWETPFDTTDPTFSQCKIDRPGGVKRRPELAGELMYIVNHYLDTEVLGMYVPNRRDARRTNAAKGVGSIEAQVELCAQVHGGKKPTAVLVDYFDKGEGLAVVERLNG